MYIRNNLDKLANAITTLTKNEKSELIHNLDQTERKMLLEIIDNLGKEFVDTHYPDLQKRNEWKNKISSKLYSIYKERTGKAWHKSTEKVHKYSQKPLKALREFFAKTFKYVTVDRLLHHLSVRHRPEHSDIKTIEILEKQYINKPDPLVILKARQEELETKVNALKEEMIPVTGGTGVAGAAYLLRTHEYKYLSRDQRFKSQFPTKASWENNPLGAFDIRKKAREQFAAHPFSRFMTKLETLAEKQNKLMKGAREKHPGRTDLGQGGVDALDKSKRFFKPANKLREKMVSQLEGELDKVNKDIFEHQIEKLDHNALTIKKKELTDARTEVQRNIDHSFHYSENVKKGEVLDSHLSMIEKRLQDLE